MCFSHSTILAIKFLRYKSSLKPGTRLKAKHLDIPYQFLHSVIRFHQFVVGDSSRECLLAQMSRMRPRLQAILLSYSLLKARRPLQSRKLFHHTLNRLLVHQLRISSHIVKNRSQLNQRSNSGESSRLAQILVTDHCLGYVLCLLYWGRVLLQEIEDNESTIEFTGWSFSALASEDK
jgi:hypothetical protein